MIPTIVTITGPSGSGKSTLEKMLIERGYSSIISVTTREPREGEVDGVHYYFRSRERFQEMQSLGQLVEMVEFNGNYYGVPKSEIEKAAAAGKPVTVVVEPKGLKQIQDFCYREGWLDYAIFVTNDPTVLMRRLLRRFGENVIAKGEAGFEKELDAAASRIDNLLCEELNWVNDAYDGIDVYDLCITHFDESTTEEALSTILREVGEYGELVRKKTP